MESLHFQAKVFYQTKMLQLALGVTGVPICISDTFLYIKSLLIKNELGLSILNANVKPKHCPAQQDVDQRKSTAVRELHQPNNNTLSEDGYEMVFSLSGSANLGFTANPKP